jgi:Flp pilus assembly protein TadB
MSLERLLIYAFLASPALIAILIIWLTLSAGFAFVLSIAISSATAWFVRGWKESLDRDYRARNWKWP